VSKGTQYSLGRRRLLRYAGASLIFSVSPLAGAAAKLPSVLAVRIWPAADYTRVTLEHDAPLKYTHFTVENPDRLVVDIEGVEFNSVLDSLARKVATDDPYIKLLRAGRFKPG
jgi:N-acetylmuramoyl-L-alanine amidase